MAEYQGTGINKLAALQRRRVLFVGVFLIFQLFIVVILGLTQSIAKTSELLMILGFATIASLTGYTLLCVARKKARIDEFFLYLLVLIVSALIIFASVMNRSSESARHHPKGTPEQYPRGKY